MQGKRICRKELPLLLLVQKGKYLAWNPDSRKGMTVKISVGKIALLAIIAAAGLATGGCNERTLFKDNDLAIQRRVEFYGSYDSETSAVSRSRKKQQMEWGFGPNIGMGGDY
jgi:hypothetical protein